MIPFHPDLITTVHEDRMERRRGEDVRWVRRGRVAHRRSAERFDGRDR